MYRTKEEIESWKLKDPIVALENYLTKEGIFKAAELEKIKQKALDDIEAAVQYANESPDPTIESLLEDVYA